MDLPRKKQWLDRCLRSVELQTVPPGVVLEVKQAWNENEVRGLINAISSVDDGYVFLLEADDYLVPDCILDIVRYGLVYDPLVMCLNSGLAFDILTTEEYLHKNIMRIRGITPPSQLVFKRSLFKDTLLKEYLWCPELQLQYNMLYDAKGWVVFIPGVSVIRHKVRKNMSDYTVVAKDYYRFAAYNRILSIRTWAAVVNAYVKYLPIRFLLWSGLRRRV